MSYERKLTTVPEHSRQINSSTSRLSLSKLLFYIIAFSLIVSGAFGFDYTSPFTLTINYITPTTPATDLQAFTGNFFVNTTWNGDSTTWNVLVNGVWHNDTTDKYYNNSLSPHNWSNVTICSADNICSSQLSIQIPNNPIHITSIQNFYYVTVGETLNIDANYTDEDSIDIGVFDRNFTNGTFDNSTGLFSWFTTSQDMGEHVLTITVNDNHGSISQKSFTVIISVIPYLAITDHSPSSDPISDLTMNQSFSINFSKEANVTWYIDSSLLLTESNVSFSSFTNASTVAGNYTVLASASDGNTTVNQTWNWTVIPLISNAPDIYSWGNSKTNDRSSNITSNGSEIVSFNISVNQTVNVTWYIDGSFLHANNSVTEANYTNSSAPEGVWNITATAANSNGSVSKVWTWTVAAIPGILGVSADPAEVSVGIPANITFTVSPALSGVLITINGSGVSLNGTSTNGTVTITGVNATYAGTIIVNASLAGYTGFTTNITVVPAAVQTSVHGSSGKSAGGEGVVSREPYSNINDSEIISKSLVANETVTYKFKTPGLAIYEIAITGKENENDISLRVEILKNTSKLVTVKAPGTVYMNLNVWAGTKMIKQALIRFKIEKSWLASNNLESSDVRLMKWDDRKWIELETVEKSEDSTYSYYEAKTETFPIFAITGLKREVAPAVEITPAKTAAAITPSPTKKVPGYGIVLTAVIVCLACRFVRKVRKAP